MTLAGRAVELVVLLPRDEVDQLLDDVVALDAFGLGVEVGDDAVTQDRGGDLADVFGADVVAALEQRAGLAGEDQVLAGAGPAPSRRSRSRRRAAAFGAAGQARELERVADHVVGDGHLADDLLQRDDLFAAEDVAEVDRLPAVVRRTIWNSSSSLG